MNFFLGVLVAALVFLLVVGALMLGMRFGLEKAVDDSLRDGYFLAYGKKWMALAHIKREAP